MNPSTPQRIITVASPIASAQWLTPKRKCVESETGLSLLARLETRPSVSEMEPSLFPDGLQPGEIIELTGTPGCGKSTMSLHLIASVLLPRTWKGACLGGCDSGVIYVDSDIHFSILQLENMMQKKVNIILRKCKSFLKGKCRTNDGQDLIDSTEELQEFLHSSKQCLKDELNRLTKKCLKSFFYLRCTDSTQFAVTLLSMNELFQNKGNVSLVVIDSMSAFYWYDRTYRAESWYKLEQYYNKIFKVFLSHIKKYKIVLVSTRQSLFQKKSSKDDYQIKRSNQMEEEESEEGVGGEYEYMGREWANSVTCRVNLSITRSSVLGVGDEIVSENSLEHSTTHNKGLMKDNENGTGIEKHSSERPIYCAEVLRKEKKAKLVFTIHEEGIRWQT